MYKTLQQHVQPRILALVLFSIVLLALLAGFLYVLKQPWQALQKSNQSLMSLQREIKTKRPLRQQIQQMQTTVHKLEARLNGGGRQLADNQMIAVIIGQLDHIANKHDVKLLSVKPGKPGKLFNFRELLFYVELEGDYSSLFQWLFQMEKELGPIVIKQFDIQANTATNQRKMSLVIASYRYLQR